MFSSFHICQMFVASERDFGSRSAEYADAFESHTDFHGKIQVIQVTAETVELSSRPL